MAEQKQVKVKVADAFTDQAGEHKAGDVISTNELNAKNLCQRGLAALVGDDEPVGPAAKKSK